MASETEAHIKVYASLRVFGDTLDPSDVTRVLQLPPDHAHRKGDLRIGRTKSGKVQVFSPYSSGLWAMSSERWVCSKKLDVHIRWIIEQIQPKTNALAELLSRGARADVFCFSLGNSSKEPPVSRQIRAQLAELDLPLEIDHYESQ